ncbi:MAG: hypothetical protein WCP28_22150, partial [Actinomycetes bacterium]
MAGAEEEASAMSKLFKGLMSGFGQQSGKKLAGWAISALAGTGGDAGQISQIQDQLNQISAQLNQMQADIKALEEAVDWLSCNGQTALSNIPISELTTMLNRYIVLLGQPTKGSAPGSAPITDPTALYEWANQTVSGPTAVVQTAINNINLNLTGVTKDTGSIKACAKAMLNNWKTPLAESDYYSQLYQYLGVFYNWQATALNLLIEADHMLALHYAPPAPTVDVAIHVCDNPPAGSQQALYCSDAQQYANVLYFNTLAQAVQAGAAYAWNVPGEGNLAIQKGTSTAWVTDLNVYPGTSEKCGNMVISSKENPCGPTVGTTDPLSVTSYAGYTFGTANFGQWNSMLSQAGSSGQKLSDRMVSAGFAPGRQDALIVYTGQTTPQNANEMKWPDGWGQKNLDPLGGSITGMCFLDTATTYNPFCAGGSAYRNLA